MYQYWGDVPHSRTYTADGPRVACLNTVDSTLGLFGLAEFIGDHVAQSGEFAPNLWVAEAGEQPRVP